MEKCNHKKEKNTALSILKKPVNWGVTDSSENVDEFVRRNR